MSSSYVLELVLFHEVRYVRKTNMYAKMHLMYIKAFMRWLVYFSTKCLSSNMKTYWQIQVNMLFVDRLLPAAAIGSSMYMCLPFFGTQYYILPAYNYVLIYKYK